MQWLDVKEHPLPKDDLFLADTGLPTAVVLAGNEVDGDFATADFHIESIGKTNIPYFETAWAKPTEVKRWMPLPSVSSKASKEKGDANGV